MVAEERKEGKVGWSVYSVYLKAAGGYIISFLVILMFILSIGAQTMTQWWLSYWLNQGSGVGYIISLEPCGKKTGLRGFLPGLTQTSLYCHRRGLEA